MTSDEQRESAGGGGGCSDNVGGDVVARKGRRPTTQGEQAGDDATHGREWTTTTSNESGCRTMGRQRSSKLDKHKELNLSPFAVILTTPSAPSVKQDVVRECTEPKHARRGNRWCQRPLPARSMVSVLYVAATLSLSVFLLFFGRAHDMVTRLFFFLLYSRHVIYTYHGTPVTHELAYFFC